MVGGHLQLIKEHLPSPSILHQANPGAILGLRCLGDNHHLLSIVVAELREETESVTAKLGPWSHVSECRAARVCKGLWGGVCECDHVDVM